MAVRVSQSTVDEIKKIGMGEAIRRYNSGEGSEEFNEAIRRFYPNIRTNRHTAEINRNTINASRTAGRAAQTSGDSFEENSRPGSVQTEESDRKPISTRTTGKVSRESIGRRLDDRSRARSSGNDRPFGPGNPGGKRNGSGLFEAISNATRSNRERTQREGNLGVSGRVNPNRNRGQRKRTIVDSAVEGYRNMYRSNSQRRNSNQGTVVNTRRRNPVARNDAQQEIPKRRRTNQRRRSGGTYS